MAAFFLIEKEEEEEAQCRWKARPGDIFPKPNGQKVNILRHAVLGKYRNFSVQMSCRFLKNHRHLFFFFWKKRGLSLKI